MTYYKCGSVYTTQNSNVVVDTASGPIANFETPLAMPLKSLKIDVNATQDLHGYNNPWPAGGGKNLLKTSGLSLVPPSNIAFSNTNKRTFSFDSYCLGLSHNNYYQPNKITSYSISENSIKVLSTAQAYGVGLPMTLEVGVQYNLSFVTIGGRISTSFYSSDGTPLSYYDNANNNYYFTVPEDTAYVVLVFKAATNDVEATFSNIQLEKGSTATDYAPYENICPISGWSEINAVRCGKNLVDIKPFNEWNSSSSYYLLLNCIPNKQVKMNFIDKDVSVDVSDIYFGFVDSNYNKVSALTPQQYHWCLNQGYVAYNRTNLSTQDNYILTGLMIYPKTEDVFNRLFARYNIVVSVNDETTYESYNGTDVTINLGGTYYGGYVSQDKDGKRELTVTHKVKLFSDLDFRRSNSSGSWSAYVFFAQMTDKTIKSAVKCSNYDYVTQSIASMQNETIVSGSSNEYIYVRDDNYTTVEDFKTANANTQLLYELAEPFTVALPDGQPIKSFHGINNIFADTGDTSLQFRKIG